MYDQACRLIHHQQIIVLIYYIQRDIFGDNLQFPAWAIHHDRNHIQRFHPVITFHRLIVHQDTTHLSRQLDAVTGSAHHTVYQELIHPEQGLPLVRYEAEMLIHLARRCFVFFRHQQVVYLFIIHIVQKLVHSLKTSFLYHYPMVLPEYYPKPMSREAYSDRHCLLSIPDERSAVHVPL